MGVYADTINTIKERLTAALADSQKLANVKSIYWGDSNRTFNDVNMPAIICTIQGFSEQKAEVRRLMGTVIINVMLFHETSNNHAENSDQYMDFDNEEGVIFTLEALLDVLNENTSQQIANAGNGRVRTEVEDFQHQKGRVIVPVRVEADTCAFVLNNRQDN